MSVDGDVLKSNSCLSRDEGENVFPEGAENGLLVLSYQGYSWVTCEGECEVRREGGPSPPG